MRNRRDVFDQLHIQAGGLQGRDRALASRSGPFDADLDVAHAKFGCLLSGLLRRALTCKGSAFATSLEAARACTGPAKGVAFGVGDRHCRVVERRVNMRNAVRNITTNSFLFVGLCHGKGLVIVLVRIFGLSVVGDSKPGR